METQKREFKKENLKVSIYKDKIEMGNEAAGLVARKLEFAIHQRGEANLILATGASQFSFLNSLMKEKIEWDKITVFHLDEYKGISDEHPASFRRYLKDRILDIVKPAKVYYLNGDSKDLDSEIIAYEKLLRTHPVDVACIGIGENGHIAFNDPPVADFDDPKWVKVVELDHECRMQQLGEGWFATIDDVPREAVSLTIPAIMNCKSISCIVPDQRKATAVYNTLFNEISTTCPATILRKHPDATLFLDSFAASKFKI